MKASDLIAKKLSLISNFAFTGQGGSVVHILDSIQKSNKIQIIPSQNEQGASLAADAYTRVSGKTGIVIATSGPGIINCFQGIACSYYDSIPGIYISGAPVRSALKKNINLRQLGFQEMDVVNIVKSFTKYSVRVTDPNKIIYEIEKCLKIANDGRKGPCLIDLPDDIQRANINLSEQKIYKHKEKQFRINDNDLKKVIRFIGNAKNPVVVVGNGVKQAGCLKEVNKFLKKFKLPYAPTWGAMDLFDSNDTYNIGSFGVYATKYGNKIIQKADLLIILGSRMNGTLIGGNPKLFSPKSKKIHIDIDPAEQKEENSVKINLSINTDLNVFLKAINKKKSLIEKKSWVKEIKLLKEKYPVVTKKHISQKNFVNPYSFFDLLSPNLKKKDIFIPDASANLVWAYQAYKFKKNQKVFTSLNHSPMGYSIAAAIGAALADKKKNNIIASIGDGSVQMNIQEIQNIYYYNLPIKIFILNNKGYGMVKQTIDTWLNSNYVGCDLKSGLSIPNFENIFKAYKIKTITIRNNRLLKLNIKKILNKKGPIMVNLMIDPNQKIEPKVKLGDSIDNMTP